MLGKRVGVGLAGKYANPSELNMSPTDISGNTVSTVVPLKIQTELINVVGRKPLVKIWLNKQEIECLWDTGSMICLMNTRVLCQNFPGLKMHSVEEFMGTRLSLSAANKTELGIVGIVLFDFSIEKDKILFQIPFVISDDVHEVILGYNVIENVISNVDINPYEFLFKVSDLSKRHVESVVSRVQANIAQSDEIGEVQIAKDQIIPGKCLYRVKCYAKVRPGVPNKTVLFVPKLNNQVADLNVLESPETLSRGRKPSLFVSVNNVSAECMVLKRGTTIGNVCEISQLIPLPEASGNIEDGKGDKTDPESKAEGKGLGNLSPEASGKIEDGEGDPESESEGKGLGNLSPEQKQKVLEIVRKYEDVFSKDKNDIGRIKDLKMQIDLLDKTPVSEAYRKIPKLLYDDVKNHINSLLANGWIVKSKSSYASPLVCVRKKDGGLRLCVDYRKLNLKTVPENQPIPRVQDILDSLGGQKWFSSLDMSQAYHQGFIHEDSRKLTAFSTPWSLYEWVVIPYGLRNAPQNFQRYMNEALEELRDKICLAYLDDILVFGKNFEEHCENLATVLEVLLKKGIKLNKGKCVLFKTEIRYLGRLISADGYRPDPADSDALDNCKIPPKTVGELHSLLGFLGYFRIYVKDFSRKMKPVYDLLTQSADKDCKKNKSKKIVWSDELQKIISDVVDYLKSPEVIAYPDFALPFIIHCDASQTGLGAVLYQKQGGRLRVISFASRTLTPAERNYNLHSGKLEFLALKWCVTEKFSDYLCYGPPFQVFTDNNPLTYVMSSAKLNASGLRWVSQLANYQFSLHYRSGRANIDADYLSRIKNPNELFALADTEINIDDVKVVLSATSHPLTATAMADIAMLTLTGETIGTVTKDELVAQQRRDDVIGPVYDWLRDGTNEKLKCQGKTRTLWKQRAKLEFQGNVLMRRTKNFLQTVIPSVYKDLIYEELHNRLGHVGPEKVLDLARRRFYWPNMQQDVEFYVRKKCRCVVDKKPNVPERAPLVPIQVTRPWEMISIDFLHLDRSKGGYEYALIVCDHFTRFTQIYATRNNKAPTAADKIYYDFILKFGFPERIHSDQGREFDNRLLRRLHQLAGVGVSRTTPYHPQGDGQPERMNRTVLNMLKTLSSKEKANWKDYVSQLAFAYNSTVNKSTGFSPFFLLFGRSARLPIDNIFGLDFETSISKSYDQYVSQWQDRMKQAIEIAQKNAGKMGDANKRSYDRKVRGDDIVVGDRVLVRNFEKGGTGKLRSYWQDIIYVVKDKHAEIPVYTIHPLNHARKTKKVHRNLLKKCNDLQLGSHADKKQKSDKPRRRRNSVLESSSSSSESSIVLRVEREYISRGEETVPNVDDIFSSSDDETFHGFEDLSTTEEEKETDEDEGIRRSSRSKQAKRVFTYSHLGGMPSMEYRK